MGICGKCCGSFALLLALLFGWLSTQVHPLGTLFSTAYKVKGFGKPGTDPVPEDLKPMPRPTGELLFDLPGGDKMPANGIGMCCRHTAYDPVSVHRTVLWFLLQGGRHIDTASMYLNHASVGQGIQDAVARGVPRSEIFLVTKVWPDNFGYDASIQRAKEMVKELGVDYIDLVLLHAPIQLSGMVLSKVIYKQFVGGPVVGEDPSELHLDSMVQVKLRVDTWKGLSTLRESGLIRNLGVSNFNIKQMKEIQDLKLAPIAANQLQYHPWAPENQKKIVQYCHENKIVVTGYFSLGGEDKSGKVLELDALNDIAKAHGRRPAQILLRWSLQKNVSIIPGTGSHKHMADNLATYSFALSDTDMERLDSMASLPISEQFHFFDF